MLTYYWTLLRHESRVGKAFGRVAGLVANLGGSWKRKRFALSTVHRTRHSEASPDKQLRTLECKDYDTLLPGSPKRFDGRDVNNGPATVFV